MTFAFSALKLHTRKLQTSFTLLFPSVIDRKIDNEVIEIKINIIRIK